MLFYYYARPNRRRAVLAKEAARRPRARPPGKAHRHTASQLPAPLGQNLPLVLKYPRTPGPRALKATGHLPSKAKRKKNPKKPLKQRLTQEARFSAGSAFLGRKGDSPALGLRGWCGTGGNNAGRRGKQGMHSPHPRGLGGVWFRLQNGSKTL